MRQSLEHLRFQRNNSYSIDKYEAVKKQTVSLSHSRVFIHNQQGLPIKQQIRKNKFQPKQLNENGSQKIFQKGQDNDQLFGKTDTKDKKFQEILELQFKYKDIIEENTKLRTKLGIYDKEMGKLEKVIEDLQKNKNGEQVDSEISLLIHYRRNCHNLQQQIEQKDDEILQLKRSIKFTKIQELISENQMQAEYTLKLLKIIQNLESENIIKSRLENDYQHTKNKLQKMNAIIQDQKVDIAQLQISLKEAIKENQLNAIPKTQVKTSQIVQLQSSLEKAQYSILDLKKQNSLILAQVAVNSTSKIHKLAKYTCPLDYALILHNIKYKLMARYIPTHHITKYIIHNRPLISLTEIQTIFQYHPFYLSSNQAISFLIQQLSLSWKGAYTTYKSFQEKLNSLIGDYKLITKKEMIVLSEVCKKKINRNFNLINNFFNPNAKTIDNTEQQNSEENQLPKIKNIEQQNQPIYWEVLMMILKIKDLIDLDERESELLVVNSFMRENTDYEWVTVDPVQWLNNIKSDQVYLETSVDDDYYSCIKEIDNFQLNSDDPIKTEEEKQTISAKRSLSIAPLEEKKSNKRNSAKQYPKEDKQKSIVNSSSIKGNEMKGLSSNEKNTNFSPKQKNQDKQGKQDQINQKDNKNQNEIRAKKQIGTSKQSLSIQQQKQLQSSQQLLKQSQSQKVENLLEHKKNNQIIEKEQGKQQKLEVIASNQKNEKLQIQKSVEQKEQKQVNEDDYGYESDFEEQSQKGNGFEKQYENDFDSDSELQEKELKNDQSKSAIINEQDNLNFNQIKRQRNY